MNNSISERSANWQVNIIGIFYIITGLWEMFVGAFAYESELPITLAGRDTVINYKTYTFYLGLIGVAIAIGLFNRFRWVRIAAIALTWWNLFTDPIIYIWIIIH